VLLNEGDERLEISDISESGKGESKSKKSNRLSGALDGVPWTEDGSWIDGEDQFSK
jgi:hypothetical protein